MKIENKMQDDIAIIEVEGSIDSKTAPEFEKSVNTVAEKVKKIIVDFTKVDFMSSAGLRVLLLLYRKIKSQNGQTVLVGVREEIKEVMSDTGFIKFFILNETIDTAVLTLK